MKDYKTLRLSPNEINAIEEVLFFLTQKYPLKKAFLYGSKARGDFDEYSDIDLLFILEQMPSTKKDKRIVHFLYDIGIKYNVLLSSLRTSVEEWSGIFKSFPIYNEIMKEGICIL